MNPIASIALPSTCPEFSKTQIESGLLEAYPHYHFVFQSDPEKGSVLSYCHFDPLGEFLDG